MLQTLLEYRDGMKEFYKNYNIRACIDTLCKSWAEIIAENIKGIKFLRYLQNNRFSWIEEKMIPDEEFQIENVKMEVNEFGGTKGHD